MQHKVKVSPSIYAQSEISHLAASKEEYKVFIINYLSKNQVAVKVPGGAGTPKALCYNWQMTPARLCARGRVGRESPANSVPVGMRHTGTEGAWYGEGKEAQS